MNKFINRKKELEFLEQKYKSNKTELFLKFCESKNYFYFMGRLESKEDTIKRFNNLFIEKFKDSSLLNSPLSNFDAIFDYLVEKANERIIFVFDEFPFLVDRFPEIVSILQDKWDSKLKKSKIMLVLLGSSVGMMEKYALDYKSPLYGRRTGQWKLDKFNISHLKEFFPKYSQEHLIYVYSVIDSIPGYLNLFDTNKSIWENISEKFFSKGEFLYEEVEILLREELRDPSNYMSIISAVAGGLTSFNEIVQKTSLDKSLLSKYLGVLEALGITERIMPITENTKEKLKSKKSLYMVKDNFFDFWFRFIYINKQEIEKGNSEIVLLLKPDLERYVSFKFESYCEELIVNGLVDNFNKVGKWWHKDKEIDIVALNNSTKEILCGECKWKDKVNALEILNELERKARYVDWNKEKRTEIFAVFAKSFSKKVSEFNGRKAYCFDLKDIEKFLCG